MEIWACDSELSHDFASHGAGPRAIGRGRAFAGAREGVVSVYQSMGGNRDRPLVGLHELHEIHGN